MDCLLDTNILIRGFDRRHPMCPLVREAGKKLYREGTKFCFAPQNIIEFWAVATRPLESNGLGIPVEHVAALVRRFKRLFTVLSELPEVYGEWERLVFEHKVIGKKVHDARLVAARNVHASPAFSPSTWTTFPGIKGSSQSAREASCRNSNS